MANNIVVGIQTIDPTWNDPIDDPTWDSLSESDKRYYRNIEKYAMEEKTGKRYYDMIADNMAIDGYLDIENLLQDT